MMSNTGFQPSDPSVASRVGEDLRAARERLGWSLAECADSLRIRQEYLAALEDGKSGALPGPAYAAGFLRGYAKALGLDADDLLRRFKAEAVKGGIQTHLAFPVPAPERGLPTGAVILLGALLAVGVYVGWYRLSGEGRLPAEVVPAIPARLAPLAEQAVPPPAGPSTPAAAPQAPGGPVGLGTAATDNPAPDDAPQMPAISPSSAAAAIPLPPVPAAVPPPPVMQASSAPPQITPASPPAADAIRLVLFAHGDAWLQVRDRSGQVLLRKVLHAGESWPVPPKPGLLLNTGNAGNTEIKLDGTQDIALSGVGTTRRDLPLDLDLIKEGKLGPPVVLTRPRPAPQPGDPAPAAN